MNNGKQTIYGKAFEYACLKSIYQKLCCTQKVVIDNSPQLITAKNAYNSCITKQQDLLKAAEAAFRIIEPLEPCLRYAGTSDSLHLSLQKDAQGQAGDVRDVMCIRNEHNWQIGLSCKHNHKAVKHNRLSATIDFGKTWFNVPCSNSYFSEITPIFTKLEHLRNISSTQGKRAYWSDLKDKEENYYVPVLKAFIKELKRIYKENEDIPNKFVHYLLGEYDFYKVISHEKEKYTEVEAFNINGSLNKPSGSHKAIVSTPLMKLPTTFYSIDFKSGCMNTLIVACNNGWEISMRIHNASSEIEPSLKFDIQLVSMPSTNYTSMLPWMEDEVTNEDIDNKDIDNKELFVADIPNKYMTK